MKQKIKSSIDLFVSNTSEVNQVFTWQDSLSKKMSALLFTLKGLAVNTVAIKQSRDIMKQNTGLFSTFRGNLTLPIASLLALQAQPERLFKEVQAAYSALKEAKFYTSDYLTVAAYLMATQAQVQDFESIAKKAHDFYSQMKSRHMFITGSDDVIYSVMLTLTKIDVEEGSRELENIYQALKGQFPANSVQAISQILMISGTSSEALIKVTDLNETFINHKMRMDRSYTAPNLAVLALLGLPNELVVDDLVEAYNYLRQQKAFGLFSIDKQTGLLFTTAIVASVYAEELNDGVLVASITTTITNIIIAQQAAITAAIIASTAASSANN
ncbi:MULTISPECIES: DUF4003 family protein [unclassified Enterococcus]|uniref:DUF4003 family protein n=1 Tax=unclassified Enterococcus TaxID=2608891 RepID=UPI001553A012|nr:MULTISPECIES: DUF4003 family protein [unclassified Enterococcus]MBS7577761.1 DUF4003 family protein [Enterococcus sp. MMGLQ5-2]MBS7584045.1 DUF4003 family protein [Enterococcus sp. MMGLQ5-1]NPD11906.1 DUF4003 family protein [Enterococcus sp. MMGLQ5-1]NPD37591.1 DUF4003 family protein [Enterococcus sp. MMGLQ5-2]